MIHYLLNGYMTSNYGKNAGFIPVHSVDVELMGLRCLARVVISCLLFVILGTTVRLSIILVLPILNIYSEF